VIRSLPFQTVARVSNVENGRSVKVVKYRDVIGPKPKSRSN
jgi:hypothetical protein